MGLLINLVKKIRIREELTYLYCRTQSEPSAHLSAGVQGLDFVFGL